MPIVSSRSQDKPTIARYAVLPLACLSAFFLPPTASAQTDAITDEIFGLSPFEVQADEGWVATETLAGSRMRTNFSDIATQLEALTLDFMNEYGANNLEEAAIYTLNVESRDEITTGNGLNLGLTGEIRIRGLTSPTNSREFFGLLSPSDNYNIDRITIASGPNSLLFGTGSPGGVIDTTLKKAMFKDFGSIRTQFDDWGSKRIQLDHNMPIIDDVLAVRIALLRDDKHWEEKYAEELRERIYGTATWKPTSSTTISAHVESLSIESHRPSTLFPRDQLTPWFEASTYGVDRGGAGGGWPDMPIFQNTATWANGIDLNGDGDFNDAGEVNTRNINYYAPNGSQQVFTTEGDDIVVTYNGGSVPITTWYNAVEVADPINWDFVAPPNREADGWSLLNDNYYPSNINTLRNLRGEELDATIYNLFLTQRLFKEWWYFKDAFLEFAYQKEETDPFSYEYVNYIDAQTPKVDANAFLPDGVTPNPNAGRLYFQGYPAFSDGYHDTENWRGTTSIELDFENKADGILRWLGRHRFAGLISEAVDTQNEQAMRYHLMPSIDSNGVWTEANFPGQQYEVSQLYSGFSPIDVSGAIWSGNATPIIGSPFSSTAGALNLDANGLPVFQNNADWFNDTKRRPQIRIYVDPETMMPIEPDWKVGAPWTIADASGRSWTMDPYNTGLVNANGQRLLQRDGFDPNGKSKLETWQFAYQGFFWKGRIVGTYGYRVDRISDAKLKDLSQDRVNGTKILWQDNTFEELKFNDRGITRTLGVVAHPIRGLFELPLGFDIGGFYNESDTFQPTVNFYDPFGSQYPGARGEGTDKGLLFYLFDGKLSARYNEYENTSGPQRAGNVPFNRFRFTLNGSVNRMKSLAPGAFTEEAGYPTNDEGTLDRVYNDLGGGDPYWVVSFREATGKEFQLNWRVSRNLDIRMTWNEQQVVESQIGNDWWDYLDIIEPLFDSYTFPENGESNPQDRNGNGVIDTYTWATAPQNNGDWGKADPNGPSTGNNYLTAKQRYIDAVINGNTGQGLIQALDGKSNEFIRENRWNLNATYRFTEGAFKGWRVGGAYRWRAAPLISYGGVEIAGAVQVDLTNPYYGTEEKFIDLTLGYRGKAKDWKWLAWLGDKTIE